MYNALQIAAYIVQYCNKKGYRISNLKLQKVLYFLQAQFLVSTQTPCFKDAIEAWDFGPVVPSVYMNYKMYGISDIPLSADNFFNEYTDMITTDDIKIINMIIDETANYSATRLVDITQHQSPWKDVYISGLGIEITCSSIKQYFEQC